ncbi:hypothetical protein [Sphingomonas sp.]|uniref:hypothetical protein n=1 Tax=Sphingomonas sp. TaxID=28214 RepID=UPI003AFF724E
MDITTLAVRDTAAIHLKDAAGNFLSDDGKPVRIIVYGPGSKPYAELEARQSARAIKRMQDNDNKVSLAPPEQRAKEDAEDLASITVSFENLTYPPAGDATGRALFESFYADRSLGFIAAQVGKACRDWGNFSGASANA